VRGTALKRVLLERGIGLDLDNTIVDYTESFARGAVAAGLDAVLDGKTALRDALRGRPDGEQRWRELQAYAYGPGMAYARPFPGVEAFFRHARARGVALQVISHKTRVAVARPGVDLRASAEAWLAAQPFASGVPVRFAATREAKVAAIAASGVALFIDDLIEVFDDPGFPRDVARWLFAPDGAATTAVADGIFASWEAMSDAAFAD